MVLRLSLSAVLAAVVGSACSLSTGGLEEPDGVVPDGIADGFETVDVEPDGDAREDSFLDVDGAPDADVDVLPDVESDAVDEAAEAEDAPPDFEEADDATEAVDESVVEDVAEEADDADDAADVSCPSGCSGHGTCVLGTCICDGGYATPACDECTSGFGGYPDCVPCGAATLRCCDGDVCSTPGWECVAGSCALACTGDMIRIGTTGVCIDRYEASRSGAIAVSVAGAAPWRNVNRWNAETGCLGAGKRLCTAAEWQSACRGPAGYPYPYGPAFTSGRCNDRNGGICRRDGSGVVITGSFLLCQGGYPGIYDMSGNVWEWVWDYTGNCGLVGGSVDCCSDAACLACAPLSWQVCDLEWPGLGFRCCLTR